MLSAGEDLEKNPSTLKSCQRWGQGPPAWKTGHFVTRYKLEGAIPLAGIDDDLLENGIMFAVIAEDYIFHGVIPRSYYETAYTALDWDFAEENMSQTLNFFIKSDGQSTPVSETSPAATLDWCQKQISEEQTIYGVVFLYPTAFEELNPNPGWKDHRDPIPFINSLKKAFRDQLWLSEDEFNAVFKESSYEPWFRDLGDSDSDSEEDAAYRKLQAKKEADEFEYAVIHFFPGENPHADSYKGKIREDAYPTLTIRDLK